MLVKFQSISKHESWTENLEAVLWSWRWDKIWGGESDGREEWSLEKVAVFKLDLLRHRAVRLSWNKCNELQDCSCHDDDDDDDDDVAGDSMIGLLLLLFPSCPTSWSFKRIADHKPRSLSEINNIFFSTFPTSKNSMLFHVINTYFPRYETSVNTFYQIRYCQPLEHCKEQFREEFMCRYLSPWKLLPWTSDFKWLIFKVFPILYFWWRGGVAIL